MLELNISQVSKTYRNGTQALQDVQLSIKPGMFGLLGPNGAGKSTLMRIIATLQEADTGSITFGDIDVLREQGRVRQILGYLPQEFGLYPKVTAEELLSHLALLKGIRDRKERNRTVQAILSLTNLYQNRKQSLGNFSGGMKQRFGIAQALLGNPQLLIVDEPTAGLDPEERIRFHNLLSELGRITVVILSTHIVSDVSDICTAMAIIHQGQVLFQGKPDQALSLLHGKVWQKVVPHQNTQDKTISQNIISARVVGGKQYCRLYSPGPPGNGCDSVPPDLKDFYFCVINGYVSGAGS